MEAFIQSIEHPLPLKAIGVPGDALEGLALHALGDSNCLFNGWHIGGPEDVIAFFNEAYE